jgi:uncharacterized protein YkwD
MKSCIVICALALMLLSGCVSIVKYNAVVLANAKQRAAIEKLNKKVNYLEQKNQELKDSIALYTGTVFTIKLPSTNTLANINKVAGIEISNDSFQNEEEKTILYYMNYVRMKPQEFLKKYVLPNLKDTTAYYEKTLIQTLRKMKPVEPLTANITMYSLALCHARESGLTGYVGHARKKGCNIKGSYNAECCAYGHASYSTDEALNYVLQLLVDEDVPSLGHREIILLDWLKSAGVSIQPHISYGENVVIDFSANN